MWSGVIYGQPFSKANSRVPRPIKTKSGKVRILWIKSKKAQHYERDALPQIIPPNRMFIEDVSFTATIYYASRRPDLDESLILDVLQKAGVYKNDRLVKEKHVYWALDRTNPRAEIMVKLINPGLLDHRDAAIPALHADAK